MKSFRKKLGYNNNMAQRKLIKRTCGANGFRYHDITFRRMYYNLKKCASRLPSVNGKIAVGDNPKWPLRLTKSPSGAARFKNGNDDFESDTRVREKRVSYCLIGVYHDWCEPFSTYPRTYDFIHMGSVGSLIKDPVTDKNKCNIVDVILELYQILRPEGTFVVCDPPEMIRKIDHVARSVRWECKIHHSEPKNGKESILVATKLLLTLPSSQ